MFKNYETTLMQVGFDHVTSYPLGVDPLGHPLAQEGGSKSERSLLEQDQYMAQAEFA